MLLGARTAAWGGGSAPTPPSYGGLCFTAETAGATVSMTKFSSPPAVSLETSVDDGATWTPFEVGVTVILLANVGDKVCFRAGSDKGNVSGLASSASSNRFVIGGSVAASGSVNSLLKRDYETVTVLPVTFCFANLFNGCTGLTAAPELPATTIKAHCYRNMFSGCTGLTSAPALPATTVFMYCYGSMFSGCTGLESAVLPAVTIVLHCYNSMFSGCTGLRNLWTKQKDFAGCSSWLPVINGAVFHHTSTLTMPTSRSINTVPDSWTMVADYD